MDGIYVGDKFRKFNFSSLPNLVKSMFLEYWTSREHPSTNSNYLTDHFPLFLTNLTQLESFYIYQNLICGPIPKELGNFKNLQILDLRHNKLTGSIPSLWAFNQLISISEIRFEKNLSHLFLDSNHINSSIPLEIGNMKNGQIPSTLANCSLLNSLSLSHNYLTGTIPSGIRDLSLLIYVNLSYNNLTGNIPLFLINIAQFNLSYNSLEGQIPYIFQNYAFERFFGNKDLCGDIKGFAHCPPTSQTMLQVAILVPFIIFFALLLIGYIFHSRCQVKKTKSETRSAKNGDMFSIWNYDGKIAYEEIIKVTKDFNIRYCIGTGSYSSIYKAQLPSGKVVALKKLHRLEVKDPTFDMSFKNEVKIDVNRTSTSKYCETSWLLLA
ncbi:mdis1-interacting receptor like kinase 2 [Quercus suber]|uniref:Mdis1-interacting receptor like kinase 2 n=1 Tax=Quercus suber TaxID=58331 RepID=A0AAW0M6G7_QUESU